MKLLTNIVKEDTSWTEIIVFGASIFFAIIDQYDAAYFGVLMAIYLAMKERFL